MIFFCGVIGELHLTARCALSTIKAELSDLLQWLTWIDFFRALVHDTARAPVEKLAILRRHIRGQCADVVHGLGGGEAAYIEALTRLKETYGRRDVMRAAILQALEKLEIRRQDPNSFLSLCREEKNVPIRLGSDRRVETTLEVHSCRNDSHGLKGAFVKPKGEA